MGLFTDLDDWDILILFDIIIFVGNQLSLIMFTLGTVKTRGYIDSLEKKDPKHLEKDSMEVNIFSKKAII